MSSVQEIEAAVKGLSPQELSQFESWYDEFKADAWDREIEEDAKSGKLDEFFERLKAENAGQPEVPLDEFLDEEELS